VTFEDRPADTSPRAWEAYNALIRAMSPEEKFIRVLELSTQLRGWVEAGVRLQYPSASDREVQLRAAARNMDHRTFVRAFGWDPDSDEPFPDGI
jgi:hypothetical protein